VIRDAELRNDHSFLQQLARAQIYQPKLRVRKIQHLYFYTLLLLEQEGNMRLPAGHKLWRILDPRGREYSSRTRDSKVGLLLICLRNCLARFFNPSFNCLGVRGLFNAALTPLSCCLRVRFRNATIVPPFRRVLVPSARCRWSRSADDASRRITRQLQTCRSNTPRMRRQSICRKKI
jgi:hypothetical protein